MPSPHIRNWDLWNPDTPPTERCLLSARLFPVLHPSKALGPRDMLWMLDPKEDGGEALWAWRASWRLSWEQLQPCLDRAATLASRRDLFFRQALHKARKVLEARQDLSLRPLIWAAVREGCPGLLLATLDQGELLGLCVGKPGPASPALPALWIDDRRWETSEPRRDTVEFAFRLLGSFILVSREFDERLRPGPERLGPVSISKPYMFCTGCQSPRG